MSLWEPHLRLSDFGMKKDFLNEKRTFAPVSIGGVSVRRPLEEMAPSTVQTYRSRARKLWLKVQAGKETPADRLELAELESLLGLHGSDIPPPGRPRKWASR